MGARDAGYFSLRVCEDALYGVEQLNADREQPQPGSERRESRPKLIDSLLGLIPPLFLKLGEPVGASDLRESTGNPP
jgi:hypothetical protein